MMKKLITATMLVFATVIAAMAQDAARYNLSGLINNKWPVDVCFEVYDGVSQGQIVYTNRKPQTPIKLLGDGTRLCEILSDGTICGILILEKKDDGTFEGIWSAPCGIKLANKESFTFNYIDPKEYAINLQPTAETSDAPAFVWTQNPDKCTGTYKFSYGEYCSAGVLTLFRENDKLKCSLECNTSAPSFNTTEVESCDCIVRDSRIVCKVPNDITGDESGECEFEILPFDDFAVVRYVADKFHCGFGMNAGVDGNYLKVKIN